MIELLIVFAVGIFIGYRVNEAINRALMGSLLKDLGITEKDLRNAAAKNGIKLPDEEAEAELESVDVRIEQHQGQLYAFRVDNDQFLGQGTDREGLISRLKENLSNVRVIVSEENGSKFLKEQNG